MGIGQPNFADYRYRIVDYLPAMYMFEYIMCSKKPEEMASYHIASYDTFDFYSWFFIICSALAGFLTLIFAQNLWSFMHSTTNPVDYMYEGGYLLSSR